MLGTLTYTGKVKYYSLYGIWHHIRAQSSNMHSLLFSVGSICGQPGDVKALYLVLYTKRGKVVVLHKQTLNMK